MKLKEKWANEFLQGWMGWPPAKVAFLAGVERYRAEALKQTQEECIVDGIDEAWLNVVEYDTLAELGEEEV